MRASLRTLTLVLVAQFAGLVSQARSADLRKAVPNDAFLAIHATHNSERDYQKKYYQEIWETIKKHQLLERMVKLITDRIPADELGQAKAVLDELKTAAKPIDWQKLGEAKELVYAQSMGFPASQHIWALRVDNATAKSAHEGFTNLFKMLEKYAGNFVQIIDSEKHGAVVTSVQFAEPQMPFSFTAAYSKDLLLISTSKQVAEKALANLSSDSAKSKFDDPRFVAAFKKLPKAEDISVIVDGRALFNGLGEISKEMRRVGNGNEEANAIASTIDLVLDEFRLLDFEVSVEYTEDNLNRSAAYGKFLPNAKNKAIVKALNTGKPFGKWEKWVPADASAYSLSKGMSLAPIYERAMAVIKEKFPNAQPILDQWAAIQEQIGVDVKKDILDSFTGESVSVSFPKAVAAGALGAGADGITAMRCQNPARIQALLDKLFKMVENEPALAGQGIQIVKSPALDGFHELKAPQLALVGIQPVIGFKDGWLILGTGPAAVKKVMDARAGKIKTIETSPSYKQFKLNVSGPVDSISYSNIAQQMQGAAQAIRQVGLLAPALLGAAGPDADPVAMAVIKEIMAMLPAIADVVGRFDFMQAKLAVTQSSSDGSSYERKTVLVIKPAN